MNKHTTLERIKNIVTDIKADDEWVNDSHTKAEHNGVCRGLDMLVKHLEVIERDNLVYPYEGYSSSGSDADYEQPTDELNRTMTEPKTFKEFIRWLEVYSPVNWEEMQRFEDEAGVSVWIRFDLEKEEDDE